MEIRMAFYALLFRVSYYFVVFLLLLATTSFSDASIVLQSSGEISSPTVSSKECTTEMNLLEQQISLLNSKNEEQEKEMLRMEEEIHRMKTLVDLKNSELEKCVSNISLLPIDRALEAKKPYGNCSFVDNAVHCENVEIGDVKAFMQRTDLIDNPLRLITLNLLRGDDFIPADILGDKKTEFLIIQYNDDHHHHDNPVASLLKVDVNAFQSTKNYTKFLKLRNIDSSQLDLGFLSGFNQLTDLMLNKVRHLEKSLPTLPLLPQLSYLELHNVTGFNEPNITFPTLPSGGLKSFAFVVSGKHSDASVSRILDWILLSSAKTLEILNIDYVGITEVPSQIPSFTALRDLNLIGNSISTIKNGSLSFSVPVTKIFMWSNNITSIEPEAFRGEFQDALVGLRSNSLTRFDESVFRPMVEQMAPGRGEINYHGNPIDCSTDNICHLAWIIRDTIFRRFVWGVCTNGTDFSLLKKEGFNHCSVTKNSP